MRYQLLGRSGLRVSQACLGTMTFGQDWGFGASKEDSRKIFDAYVAAGGNFLDTAINYTNGTSEAYLGEFLRGQRERFVLATKYTLSRRPDDPNGSGNHRKNMVQSVEHSLRQLGTDYIDLYWLHAWDFMTPVEEVMRGLDDLVRAGKILYIGISDTPAWIVSQANTMADLRGWSRFVALQIQYSLVERTPERELLPMAQAFDIAVTTWGILGSGALSGKYRKDAPKPAGSRLSDGPWGDAMLNDRNLAIAEAVHDVARELDRPPSQVAIAWVLAQHRKRSQIIPIVGARSESQLQDNLGAFSIELSEAQLARLEEVSQISLGFPHDFLPRVRGVIYGQTYDKIDSHPHRS
jgi:aryl-alcohol dehydrogenase-like predicted oxidoreductase